MQKLKIAIFHLAFVYSGGGEKLVLQEYDGLTKRGHKVDIYTTVINKKLSFPEIIGNYKIKTFLPGFKIFKGHEALKTVLSCVLVPFYAYKFKNYDIILAANQPSPWIAFIINKMYGVPFVSYLAQPTRFLHPRKIDRETGLFFTKKASESISARLMMTTFRKFSNWADQISIKNSSAVLVNGEHIKNMIEKVYKIKCINCPSGVNVKKRGKGKRKNYLLVTNRHFAQKRLEYAIFALNTLLTRYPNYRLIITGTKSLYTQRLISLSKELGIRKNIEFAGYVSQQKLNKLYKEAALYLYTAPEEDFGMGIIEAMSFGCPVVAWNNSGPSKSISHGVDGLLANPFDMTDFSKKVEKIITDKKLAKIISAAAMRKVQKEYSYKTHIDRIETAMLNLLKGY